MIFCLIFCLTGRCHLAAAPFFIWVAPERPSFFVTKKGSEKSLAVPRQRTPAQGARPLGTPKLWSRNGKAKTCRSAARFLTLFRPSPIDPSGAKYFLVGVGADSISARHVRVFDGASALGGQNDGRQPAKLARSCGSMPHWGIDRCATPQRRPLHLNVCGL